MKILDVEGAPGRGPDPAPYGGMNARIACLSVSLGFVALAGCGRSNYAFPEADDVRMEPVREYAERSEGEFGDVYVMSLQGAHEVNGWVGETIETSAAVIELLDRFPASGREDGWDRYGPYDDRLDRDLSWVVRIDGDPEASKFELRVGSLGATEVEQTDLLLSGELAIDDSMRLGHLEIDFDTLEAHPDLKGGPNADRTFAGSLEIDFKRDLESEFKEIDIAYHDFSVVEEYPVPDYFSAGSYTFHRGAHGSGEFHVDLQATFQSQIWSGPGVEEMILDLEWDEDGAGRGSGQLNEQEDGDLSHGDLAIAECFGSDGKLTYRALNDEYAALFPDYAIGGPEDCALEADGKAPQ
jgi:hypothetical protein